MRLRTLIHHLLKLVIDLVEAATLGIVVRSNGWSYQRNLKYTLLRSLVRNDLLDVFLKPRLRTTVVYREYMKEQGFEPKVVTLEQGALGGWIGSSNAKSVLLFFHGGGYAGSASPALMQILGEIVATTQREGMGFSIFVVEYGLIPMCRYPEQIVQGVHALKYLLNEGKRDPEDIYISGESAGGNLAIGVMAHLSHPHPAAPVVELAEKKLGGIYLISPWVSFKDDSISMKTNQNRDFLSCQRLKGFSDLFVGTSGLDGYNMPLSAPSLWWKDLQVQNLCVIVGEYEIFLTDIEEWAAAVKIHNPQTEYYVAPAEVHVGMVVDRALKLPVAKSETHFKSWMMRLLRSSRVRDDTKL